MSSNLEVLPEIDYEPQADSKRRAIPMPASKRTNPTSDDRRRWLDEETLQLVQQVFLLQTQEPPRVVVFASVDPGDGCSRIAASVAELLAKNARRPVCLVDANFRTPALAEMFGATSRHGLTEALLQKGPISSFAEPVAGTNLWLLAAGTLAPDSPNLFASAGLQERLAELRRDFDFVIIDAPPLGRYSDALMLGKHSEGAVLVLEADSTRRESASAAVARLRAASVPILAAVLNKRTYPMPEKLYKNL